MQKKNPKAPQIAQSRDKPGRPKSGAETADVVKGIRFRQSDAQRLENMRIKTTTPVATFIKRAVEEALEKYESGYDDSSFLPFITSDITGEFATVIQSADKISVGDFGKLLRAKVGDFLVKLPETEGHVGGFSYENVLLMRPYRDPDNQICLIGILGSDDVTRYIVCRWLAMEAGAFELRDAANNKIELPESAQEVYPVAVQRAVLTIQDEGTRRFIFKQLPTGSSKDSKISKSSSINSESSRVENVEEDDFTVTYYEVTRVPRKSDNRK